MVDHKTEHRRKDPFDVLVGVLVVVALAAISLMLGTTLFFVIWGADVFPSRYDRCEDALPNALVMESFNAPNGNILCKIIDANSVERSVWLDADGEVLK